MASTDTTYEYITFPGLTITNLHPGDAITIVRLGLETVLLTSRVGSKEGVIPDGICIIPILSRVLMV